MKKLFFVLAILFPVFFYAQSYEKAITYGLGSRMGDNVLNYTRAKWLSYKYGLPMQ
jgi:hypothetical protein